MLIGINEVKAGAKKQKFEELRKKHYHMGELLKQQTIKDDEEEESVIDVVINIGDVAIKEEDEDVNNIESTTSLIG